MNNPLLAQCTADERKRMREYLAETVRDSDGYIRVVAMHPERLHAQFVEANTTKHGWSIVGEPERIDGGMVLVGMEQLLPRRASDLTET